MTAERTHGYAKQQAFKSASGRAEDHAAYDTRTTRLHIMFPEAIMRRARHFFVICFPMLVVGGQAAAGAPHGAKPAATGPNVSSAHHGEALEPDEVWAKLQIGNRRFVQGRPMHHEVVDARGMLSGGQHPWVIVLGCADSRVSPELVFDQGLGDMFVVRTAGNVADPIALGSIEYAVEHLHPSALVVLGHEKCGAVTAAASGEKMPTANLEAVVRKIRPALADFDDLVMGEELVRRGVESNVHRCALDLVKDSPIVRKHVEESRLTIVKAVYDLDTGEVDRLD